MRDWLENFIESNVGQVVLLIIVIVIFALGLILGANDLPY